MRDGNFKIMVDGSIVRCKAFSVDWITGILKVNEGDDDYREITIKDKDRFIVTSEPGPELPTVDAWRIMGPQVVRPEPVWD